MVKKKICSINYLFVALIFFTSCLNKKNDFQKTNTGFQYKYFSHTNGRKPIPGEILLLHLSYRDEKDSVWYDSKILGDSFLLEMNKPVFNGDLNEGFEMMSQGDSAAFLIPADSVFKYMFHEPMPAKLKKGSYLRFDVKLKKIMSRPEMKEFLRSHFKTQSDYENAVITKYINENGVPAEQKSNGIYLVILQDGNGPASEVGNNIYIEYRMKSLQGELFDTRGNEKEPYKILIGKNDLLPAIDKNLVGLKTGGLYRIIIDSENAYGKGGNGIIPKNTPLVFEFRVFKIEKYNTKKSL